jgi:hypothetical protein
MRALLLLLVLLPALAGAEEIYRTTDDQGNPLFTDDPPSDDAEPVKLDPITTVPAAEPDQAPDPASSGGAQETTDQAGPEPEYEGIVVEYPPADQAVRHNGGLVPVRVALRPEGARLAEGHQVEVLLDGEVRGRGASLQVSVSAVARGPHTVRARVIDAQGRPVVSSAPVDFMLLRVALGNEGD